MADIVGIGCAVFDFMLLLDHWPEEDSKTGSRESKVQCGGPCAVAMIAASKLGISSAYIGKVGDDVYGLTIQERLAHYGVDTSALQIVPGGSSMRCVVLSNHATSSRTCIGGGGGNTEDVRLKPEDIDTEMIRQARYLHLDGMYPEAALHAARIARESGVRICIDADGTGAAMEELMGLADVLIPSERCAYAMAGTRDEEEAAWYLYRRFRPEVFVMTQGPRGGILITEDRLVRYPVYAVDALDSNGAGDVFHGAWIAASLRGMSPYEASCFASAASAIKCTHFGASEGAPHFDEVIEFLKNRQNLE